MRISGLPQPLPLARPVTLAEGNSWLLQHSPAAAPSVGAFGACRAESSSSSCPTGGGGPDADDLCLPNAFPSGPEPGSVWRRPPVCSRGGPGHEENSPSWEAVRTLPLEPSSGTGFSDFAAVCITVCWVGLLDS